MGYSIQNAYKGEIPDDIYQGILTLGYFAIPHDTEPIQAECSAWLRETLASNDADLLPEALREIGRAFQKDIKGRNIPISRNWILRSAFSLADQVDAWLEEQQRVRAKAA